MPCRKCGDGFRDTDQILLFEGRRFHLACFTCNSCGKSPTSPDEMKSVRDLPYCSKTCWNEAVKTKCGGCGEALSGKGIKAVGIHYAYHPDCFKCERCSTKITGKFQKRNNKPYCFPCFQVTVKEAQEAQGTPTQIKS